jgi:ribulose-5-phosphate 4-epimerase/fuculose-1-phosphate aldolase
MSDDSAAREKLATCTRIFAMQGLLTLFGHVSMYLPASQRVLLSPGMGCNRAQTRAESIFVLDHSGKILEEGEGGIPVEWPIHTALHASRSDALAVAHLHSPFATLFAIAKREFRPVTLQGALFAHGVPLYEKAQLIKTPDQGRGLMDVIGDKRAALLRGHGVVMVGRDIEEALYSALIFEDDAQKTLQAATLGEVGFISLEECNSFDGEDGLQRRSHRAWDYFSGVEAQWDRQPGTGACPLLP